MRSLLPVLFVFLFLTNYSQPGFIANRGQMHDQHGKVNHDVLFAAPGEPLTVFLRQDGYSYQCVSRLKKETFKPGKKYFPQADSLLVSRIDISFLGCENPLVEVAETDPGILNYYTAVGAATGLEAVRRVVYKGLYPGIDVVFHATGDPGSPLKYDILLSKDADLSLFRMKVTGAALTLKDSRIVMSGNGPAVTEKIPLSYYGRNQSDRADVRFEVNGDIISLSLNNRKQEALVIDPACSIMWSTYMGGNAGDVIMCSGADSLGFTYYSGYTFSNANLATTGAYQFTLAGGVDAFLAKFNGAGQRIWSTYIGGTATDLVYAMTVLPDGSSYITGATNSTAGIASPGTAQTGFGGGINDAFLARFTPQGQRTWGTYYGGEGHDIAQCIASDKQGNVFIAGHTESTVNIATPGAYKTVYNFNYDVCIARFSPAGALLWGSYYGDSGVDEAYGMALDSLGNPVITGGTQSISDISTPGTFQQNPGGSLDAFIAKIKKDGTALLWGTYYGGTGVDAGIAVRINRQGIIFNAGNTGSPAGMSTPGAYQVNPGSADDSYLAAFTDNGLRIWSTYFGGNDAEYINDMVLDRKSDIFITGSTASTLGIAQAGACQSSNAATGYYDAFLARFSPAGSSLMGTYFGGEVNESAHGLCIDASGRLFMSGETTSTAGIATTGVFQPSYTGNGDAFITRYCLPFTAPLVPARSQTYCAGSVTLSTSPGFSTYLWSNGAVSNPLILNLQTPGKFNFSVQLKDGNDCIGRSDTVSITISKCLGLQEKIYLRNLNIMPNPASGSARLACDNCTDGMSYLILSGQGQLLKTGDIAGLETQLELQDLSSGMYLLQLTELNGQLCGTLRFIIQ